MNFIKNNKFTNLPLQNPIIKLIIENIKVNSNNIRGQLKFEYAYTRIFNDRKKTNYNNMNGSIKSSNILFIMVRIL